MKNHVKSICPERLTDTFWLPSYCPRSLAMNPNRRLDALVDAYEVAWDGGKYCTTRYRCPCCGTEWADECWLAWIVFARQVPPVSEAPIVLRFEVDAEAS